MLSIEPKASCSGAVLLDPELRRATRLAHHRLDRPYCICLGSCSSSLGLAGICVIHQVPCRINSGRDPASARSNGEVGNAAFARQIDNLDQRGGRGAGLGTNRQDYGMSGLFVLAQFSSQLGC